MTCTISLPRCMRLHLERRTGFDASRIRVVVGDEPKRLGAYALAVGDEIHVGSRFVDLPAIDQLFVLAHELGHVIQQRRFDVSAFCDRGRHEDDRRSMCRHVVLEQQADAFARDVVWGLGSRRLRSGRVRSSLGELCQPIVSLGGEPLGAVTALGPSEQMILGLMGDGHPFVAWAAETPSLRLEFASSADLLHGVSQGLHGSANVRLSRLGAVVSPLKLLELGEQRTKSKVTDLERVVRYERRDDSNPVPARRALKRHGIWSCKEFEMSRRHVRDLVQEDSVSRGRLCSFLGSMTLAEEVALAELYDDRSYADEDEAVRRAAACFAAQQAASTLEFVDYQRFYVAYCRKAAAGERKVLVSEERLAEASVYLQQVKQAARGLLISSRLEEFPGPRSLVQWVRSSHARGSRLGFSRLSSAAAQLMANSSLDGETGKAAAAIVEHFVEELHEFVETRTEGPPPVLSQDGASLRYRYRSEQWRAQLVAESTGLLSVESFEALEGRES